MPIDPLLSDDPDPDPDPARPAGRLRVGSLCTGYGGLDLAVQAVLGGRLVFVADPDRYIRVWGWASRTTNLMLGVHRTTSSAA